MRKIIVLLALLFTLTTAMATSKTSLKVLYVGGSADVETFGMVDVDSAVVAKSKAQRMASWKSYLETYFTTVKAIPSSEYNYKMSDDYDVTIIDGTPEPLIPRQYQKKNGRITKVINAKYYPDDFSRPVITIADKSETVGRRLGVKNDWFCLCLTGYAFGMNMNNPIFKGPYPVNLTLKTMPVPEAAKEYGAITGDKVPQTVPMWLVHRNSYDDVKGAKIGMVSRPWGYLDSPDAEIISGGKSAKSFDAVAIGRHANFLHWGFAGSPAYMTDEAKNVFANAVVYISKFAGHHVIARKLFEGISTDIDIKENANRVKKSTWESYKKEIEANNLLYAHYADSIKAAHPDGKYSKSDEQILMIASHPEQVPSYEDFVARSAGPLYAQYGTDEAAYAKYYAEHAPYFYGSLNDYGLALDSDAMNLGIKVGDLKLLDKAIRLWEHGDNVDMAKRILYHYTLLRYDNAKAFRDWYKKYSKKIFFTQSGGWLYLVNDLDPQTPGNDYSVLHYNDLVEDKPALGAESTKDDPLVLSARIDPDEYQEGVYDLVVRIKLYPGFHIYDVVSDQDPYIVNEYHTTFTGNFKTVGPLQKPNGNRLGSTGTIVFSGDNIFHQKIEGSGAGKVTFSIRYQACDDHACLMPTEKTVTVDIPSKR